MAWTLQPGMRAIGLKVTAESSGGGFVLPHSRVDLVHVVRNEKETTSKIIMQNVLVLAVDQAAVKPEDKNSFIPQTVTVEVTPSQAEEIALAQDIGSIRLILRSFGDDERIHTPGVSPKSIGSNRDGKVEETDETLTKESAPKLANKIPDHILGFRAQPFQLSEQTSEVCAAVGAQNADDGFQRPRKTPRRVPGLG